ncbi:MAG: HigA family addiction module antidote protein [Candidatus Eisenbacteria bacterium]|nr:HigA family addiction module antidote protein [Candidatus Eisenbacteria bacterium]
MKRPLPIEVFPPGDFIREELDARGWTQDVLAEVLGRPARLVSEIITGKRAITPETAQGLGEAFGTGAQVWMNLEAAYRLSQVRGEGNLVARRARLYSKAPVKEMIRRHWIEHSASVDVLERRVLDFLGIDSLDEEPTPIPHAARKSTSYSAVPPAQCAWLIRASRLARAVSAVPFTETRFERGLSRLRELLHSPEEVRQVPRVLADAGVRFVVVEHLSQTRIDGAALWLDGKSPVVALSLRFDRMDYFWHTLLHDLMHIRNGDVGPASNPLVDSDIEVARSLASSERPPFELIADKDAAEFLVPQAELDGFVARTRPLYAKVKIAGFAHRLGIHPGIIVGQLQHRGEIPFAHSREMLVKVRSIVTSAALTDGWGCYAPAGL